MDKIVSENTEVQFITRTQDIWDAMYQDCLNAEKSIEFEQYILRDDEAGHRFLRLFIDKVHMGVSVRLILDKIGSRQLYSSPLLKELRESGGRVYFYNSIGWQNLFRPDTWFPRNHSKMMLLDSKVCYLGSACIAEHMKGWRDTQMRFTGDLVKDVQKDFGRIWERLIKKARTLPSWSSDKTVNLRYIATRPRFLPNPIYKELLHEINHAQKNICLVTPYFLPPWRLRRALCEAVVRGVNVRVMMGEKTDVWIADYVSHSYFLEILKYDIKIFLYTETVMHAKYAIVDDKWATLGSTNMDYLSLVRNREANVIIRDRNIIAQLRKNFEEDLNHCRQVDKSYEKGLPILRRVIGYAGRSIRRIL